MENRILRNLPFGQCSFPHLSARCPSGVYTVRSFCHFVRSVVFLYCCNPMNWLFLLCRESEACVIRVSHSFHWCDARIRDKTATWIQFRVWCITEQVLCAPNILLWLELQQKEDRKQFQIEWEHEQRCLIFHWMWKEVDVENTSKTFLLLPSKTFLLSRTPTGPHVSFESVGPRKRNHTKNSHKFNCHVTPSSSPVSLLLNKSGFRRITSFYCLSCEDQNTTSQTNLFPSPGENTFEDILARFPACKSCGIDK